MKVAASLRSLGWEGEHCGTRSFQVLGREFSGFQTDGVRGASRAPGPGSREATLCSGSGAAAIQEALGRMWAGWERTWAGDPWILWPD